jgi:hypothetical protein
LKGFPYGFNGVLLWIPNSLRKVLLEHSMFSLRAPWIPIEDSRHSLKQKLSIRTCSAMGVLKDSKGCYKNLLNLLTDLKDYLKDSNVFLNDIRDLLQKDP